MATGHALKSVEHHGADLPPVYDGPIFDGDTHIHEKDFSFFARYLPEKYHADWLISIKAGSTGRYGFHVGDRLVETHDEMSPEGWMAPPGKLKEWLAAIATGEQVGEQILPQPDFYTAADRLKKLDEFGVDGSILFIGQFVGCLGTLVQMVEEKGPEGANAAVHAYNQYMLDQWTFNLDDRIYATPVLTLWDLDAAIAEAKWLIENGVRVVVMPMGPHNGRAAADPYYDPVWNLLNDAGVAIAFHVSEANFMHPLVRSFGETPLTSRRAGQTAWQWMFTYSEIPVMMTMASFIYLNFFARFPNIRMISVENGAEWLPRFLYKLDKMRGMARSGFWPQGQLTERPSTIFKRNCFVVAYPEDDLQKIVAEIGDADCLMMGSDYPHAEGVPEPRDFSESCRGLTETQIRQIMHDNGRRFMPRSK